MSSSSKRTWGICALVSCVLLLAGILLGVSLKKLDSTEYGVMYDTNAKKILGVKLEGLHSGPLGYRFIIFPSIYRQENINTTCVSRDGIYITCAVTFQWVAHKSSLLSIVKKYKDMSTLRYIVIGAAISAINDGCAQFNVSQYQEQRTDVQLEQQSLTKERLDSLGVDLAQLSLRNVDYPAEWSAAVSNKEKARQDIMLATNERQQQLLIATTNFNISEQQAQIILANATREAQEINVNAQAQADNIRFKYQTETQTMVMVKKVLNLTEAGLLTYLSSRALSQSVSLDVAADHPAKVSYQDAL